MSMRLVSEALIKREIERFENNPELIKDDTDRIWLHMCKTELAVIERLKINNVDLRGAVDDVVKRLESQAIYFMEPQEFESMKEGARRYNAIVDFINKKEE